MTVMNKLTKFRLKVGMWIRGLGQSIQGPYWVCTRCGNIEYREREIMCWKCGRGEMIYQGYL